MHESHVQFAERLHAARDGSVEALGQILNACRQYLLLIANESLAGELHAKLGASDVVQETFLEAQRDFPQFRGDNERELLAWLRRMLLNNLLNQRRLYQGTFRRDVRKEVPWDSAVVDQRAGADLSPSETTVVDEERQLLCAALGRLPEHYREILELRHQRGLSFVEIGQLKGQSPDAVRMLWWRAYERLASQIGGDGASTRGA